MGISCWIAHKAVWSPDSVAVTDHDVPISYAAFEPRIAHLAGYLADELRVAEGERVAYLGGNRVEVLELLFACARLGAIFVPLNARMTAVQLAVMLDNADPVLLVHAGDFAELARASTTEMPSVALVQLADPVTGAGGLDTAKLVESSRRVGCNPNRDQRIPGLILYTSGTTGTPKGAVFTQDALTFTAINSNNVWNMGARDHVLTFLPMFHAGGLLIHTLPAMHIGAQVTILGRPEPGEILRRIGRDRATLILAPPLFSQQIIAHPDWAETDLSELRCVGIGSTFVPPEVMKAWLDRDVPTQQNYGLTEGVPILAVPWAQHKRKSDTAGTSVLYTQARVFDENLQRVPIGEPGEIMLRGRSLFSGYWRNDAATEAAFVDGWFRTGDIAWVDDEGYFHIVDRKKNIVIVGSSNVYPADLEKIMTECPQISEGAVVGVPDGEIGEALAVCVIRKGAINEAEVRALFHGRLAAYQQPQHVLFFDEMPRTSLGKVQKVRLAEDARAALGV